MSLFFPKVPNPYAPIEQSRFGGAGFAVLIHGVVVLALILGVLDPGHTLEQIAKPLAVRMIEDIKPEQPKPPPKPQPKRATPAPMPVLAVNNSSPAPSHFVVPVQPPAPPVHVPISAPVNHAPAPEQTLVEARFDADYLSNPKPVYPSASRRLNETGTVHLRVHVDEEGRAMKVELKTSSGFERLDRSALDTVAQWRFVPAKRGNRAVPCWVVVPIVFSLA